MGDGWSVSRDEGGDETEVGRHLPTTFCVKWQNGGSGLSRLGDCWRLEYGRGRENELSGDWGIFWIK